MTAPDPMELPDDMLVGLDESPPAPDPAPAAPAEGPPAASPPPPDGDRNVPLATFLEQRRVFQDRLAAQAEQLEALQKRVEAGPPKPAEPEPDFIDDPKGYVDRIAASARKEAADAREAADAIREAATRRDQLAAFGARIQAEEAKFVEKTPDYMQAITHIRTSRVEEIKLLYPDATDDQIAGAIQQEELALADAAIRANKSPAEVAYQVAVRRGFKSATPASKSPAPDLAALTGGRAPVDAALSLAGAGSGAPAEAGPTDDGLEIFDAARRERGFGR